MLDYFYDNDSWLQRQSFDKKENTIVYLPIFIIIIIIILLKKVKTKMPNLKVHTQNLFYKDCPSCYVVKSKRIVDARIKRHKNSNVNVTVRYKNIHGLVYDWDNFSIHDKKSMPLSSVQFTP